MHGNKWNQRFLKLAQEVGSWSKDPSTKTGAVLVDGFRRVLGTGYNGFARGVQDTDERLNDRPTKYKMVVHAEANAILNATGDTHGSALYVHPWPPCSQCAAMAIQAGVAVVIAPTPTPEQVERWGADFELTRKMFEEAGVDYHLYDR